MLFPLFIQLVSCAFTACNLGARPSLAETLDCSLNPVLEVDYFTVLIRLSIDKAIVNRYLLCQDPSFRVVLAGLLVEQCLY